jgi:pre-60S factor REI1
VAENADHMLTQHGLYIPDRSSVSDLESFLGYLATEVRVWHECLYCGTIRNSTSAIQSHMRDTRHCTLNLEREPELAGFWEPESRQNQKSPEGGTSPGMEVRNRFPLRSGHLIRSRCDPSKKKSARNTQLALRAAQSPQLRSSRIQSCRQLAPREEMGMQNISSQQRHALMSSMKRSQKEEATETRAREWSYARKGNSQKHDQAYGPLSWAKGGAHNLLPR